MAASGVPKGSRRIVGAGLAVALVVAVALALVQPFPEARHYGLAVRLVVSLGVIWYVCAVRTDWLRGRVLPAVALIAAAVVAPLTLLTMDRDAEVVHVYDSVLATLDRGEDPYVQPTVYHRLSDGSVVYGTFNYPPLELYPMVIARDIAGRWDAEVLLATTLFLNTAAVVVLALAFRRRPAMVLPWLPLLVVLELKANVSMVFLVVAVATWILAGGGWPVVGRRRIALAVVLGVGLTAKFLVLPIALTYLWCSLDRRLPRSAMLVARDLGLALGTAVVLCAPFGVVPVVRSTILFNLRLGERATMTTWYPNVVSGLCRWLGGGAWYAVVAVALVGAAVLLAPRLGVGTGIVVTVLAFLLAAPTPEPQFLPVVAALALATSWTRLGAAGAATVPASTVGVRSAPPHAMSTE